VRVRTIVYYFFKATFMDQALFFLYWILAIYGLIKIGELDANLGLKILATVVYIPAIIFVYFVLAKKCITYFKTKKKVENEDSTKGSLP